MMVEIVAQHLLLGVKLTIRFSMWMYKPTILFTLRLLTSIRLAQRHLHASLLHRPPIIALKLTLLRSHVCGL